MTQTGSCFSSDSCEERGPTVGEQTPPRTRSGHEHKVTWIGTRKETHYVRERASVQHGGYAVARGAGAGTAGWSVATYVHTSAMVVGLTSLGHLWTGRRIPHNHYVIGDPADTTLTAYFVRHCRQQAPDCWGLLAIGRGHRGAAEHYVAWLSGQRLQGGPQRRCLGATIPGTAGSRPNRECGLWG